MDLEDIAPEKEFPYVCIQRVPKLGAEGKQILFHKIVFFAESFKAASKQTIVVYTRAYVDGHLVLSTAFRIPALAKDSISWRAFWVKDGQWQEEDYDYDNAKTENTLLLKVTEFSKTHELELGIFENVDESLPFQSCDDPR